MLGSTARIIRKYCQRKSLSYRKVKRLYNRIRWNEREEVKKDFYPKAGSI